MKKKHTRNNILLESIFFHSSHASYQNKIHLLKHLFLNIICYIFNFSCLYIAKNNSLKKVLKIDILNESI